MFQAEDGIRDLVRSRGLGDVYKRQVEGRTAGVTSAGRVAGVLARDDLLEESLRRAHRALSLIHI